MSGLRSGALKVSAILLLVLAFSASAETFDSIYISEALVLPKAPREHGWIELYNGGSRPVNLANWFLSDNRTNLTKWRFPRVVMLPDTYLVVQASGQGSTNNLVEPHANFSLDGQGGRIVLAKGGTNVVSQLDYPKAEPNVSFGSVRGEPSIRGGFDRPTPGKANQIKGEGFAPAVVFSRPSGSFTSRMAVALSCLSTSNVVIRYTLDGSFPDSSSPIYRGALEITNTTAVRARAYQEGLLPSAPGSEVYVLIAPDALNFKSNLPVLIMNSFSRDGAGRPNSAYMSFHEPVNGRTSLDSRPTLVTRGGFHVRGSSTMRMPQQSLAMEFYDEFNDGDGRSAIGLPSNSDWALYAPNVFDPVMIHNQFVHQLARDMGVYSSRTRSVEVFIVSQPGPVTAADYAGLYVLEEKIKIGKNRLAIDKLGPEDLKEPEVTGGYLLKLDRLGPMEQGVWAGGAQVVYVDPKESVINLPQRAPQREYIANYLDEFAQALDGPDWKDPVKGYPAYIDVDAWIDYHVLELLVGNVDVFHYSSYFYKPRGGKLTFGPHWDYDRAMGSIDRRDAYPRRWNTGRFFEGPWWNKIFRDPDFWQLWVDRWQTLRGANFSKKNLFTLIDRFADEVREAQPREQARWNLHPRGDTYQSEVDWMKRWLSDRMDFIDRQLTQPPTLSQVGGEVEAGFKLTLNAAEGSTVYYTLDGSDPRRTQGDVSPVAEMYSEPITIDRDMRLKVRARNPETRQVGGPPVSTPWSSSVSAEFSVRQR
ncbi:MAG TPA: CotH kinase family protein [Verrucomicrobiae bacterium]|nr:CotH kinase family protein [Verrucomicrobiae bacterium]